MTALHIASLTKRYGERAALSQLGLDIGAGQLVALLGPNGAGKSTLFQVLTGLFVADEGEVEVAGHSLRHSAVAALRHIGVVFQQMSLDLDLSVERNLRFHADLHGLPRALARERIVSGCAALGIVADLARPVQQRAVGHPPGRRGRSRRPRGGAAQGPAARRRHAGGGHRAAGRHESGRCLHPRHRLKAGHFTNGSPDDPHKKGARR